MKCSTQARPSAHACAGTRHACGSAGDSTTTYTDSRHYHAQVTHRTGIPYTRTSVLFSAHLQLVGAHGRQHCVAVRLLVQDLGAAGVGCG